MLLPTIPADEDDRLAELDRLELMYSAPEAEFDRVTAELASVFDVPAAMMSLIDRDTQYYKSTVGVPPEVLGDRTVPRQASLCAHVIAANEPLVVEDLQADERFRDNPMVLGTGIRFYAGAPLQSDNGQPIGTLCVVDLQPRKITDRERRLLKMIANGLMSEAKLRTSSRRLIERTRVMEQDLSAARAVQRFLLPPPRQEGNGFAICHWYQPFDAIGGDFVDARVRADGSLVMLVADVSGHGASAALTSAMAKTVFQRAAPDVDGPGPLLEALNRDLTPAVDSGRFMTATAAVFDAARGVVRLASAGHPYPILLRGGKAAIIEVDNDVPLLIESNSTYIHETTLPLEAGDRVVFYTDGAIEAADPSGTFLETSGLLKLVVSNSNLSGGEFVRHLFQDVRTYAAGRLLDDVALVALEVI